MGHSGNGDVIARRPKADAAISIRNAHDAIRICMANGKNEGRRTRDEGRKDEGHRHCEERSDEAISILNTQYSILKS